LTVKLLRFNKNPLGDMRVEKLYGKYRMRARERIFPLIFILCFVPSGSPLGAWPVTSRRTGWHRNISYIFYYRRVLLRHRRRCVAPMATSSGQKGLPRSLYRLMYSGGCSFSSLEGCCTMICLDTELSPSDRTLGICKP
jgi:hypothetical protein